MEAQLVDSHWVVDAVGAKPTALGDSALDTASPLRGLDPGKVRTMHSIIEAGLHQKGICFLENEAPVSGSVYIPGVAGWFGKKYAGLTPKERGEKIYQDLWREGVKGIALHEIGHSLGMLHQFGHSLGMLHQFASSWDAPNFNRRIPSQTTDRYFERVRAYHWQVANSIGRSDASALDDDNDLRPYALAEKDMFGLLAKSVLMPEPGGYGPSGARTPVDSLKQIFDTNEGAGGTFNINIVDGRYIGEDYNNELGGSWDYIHWINHAGFSVEKASAIQALVDGRPTLYTISRDNFLDGRGVKINFRTDMAEAVDRMVGGLLAEDWESIAPYVMPGVKDPSPQLTDLGVGAPARPANAMLLFPNIGYKQQLATAMFTALFSRLNTDMTLVNKMRVWLEGATDAISIPDDQSIKFTDPSSGYTYVAKKYGPDTLNGKTVDKGVASRMLAHANALASKAYQIKAGGPDKFGRPVLDTDASGNHIVLDADRASELTLYVGLIDSVREVGYRLGYGPLGSSWHED